MNSLSFRQVAFELGRPTYSRRLEREVERFPFVPVSPARRHERCAEAYEIQVQGLVTRMRATEIRRVVLGISGGLDATHALLVACQVMDELGRPRQDVLAYTMPRFATSVGTRTNAWRLMDALGIAGSEIDIRPSATSASSPWDGAPTASATRCRTTTSTPRYPRRSCSS